jgi:hypothetical protein
LAAGEGHMWPFQISRPDQNIGFFKYSEPVVSTIPKIQKKKKKPRTLLLLIKIKYPPNIGR